jgi:GntR family transcriptional regulator, transcriptional repressor for pyruvate dehydrogenase complex
LAKLGHSRIDGLVKPVRPQSLDSAVLDALASYVDHANILPHSRLPSERVLCEALGVGRSTVREALKRWEALGIVEMRKGSGAYLKVAFGPNLLHVPLILARPSKVKNLLQILQVRRALEGEAAAICAMSASDEDVAAIEAALVKLESAHAKGGCAEEDWQFHQQIFASTANPFFRTIIQSMRDLLHQLWENALALPDFAEASHPFHRTMYEAIARRNPKSARTEAWKLIDSVEREIREAFPDEV